MKQAGYLKLVVFYTRRHLVCPSFALSLPNAVLSKVKELLVQARFAAVGAELHAATRMRRG